MAKRSDIVRAAIHAYADPYDPDQPTNGVEVVDKTIEFLEAFAGLDLDACATPGGKTYDYSWLLKTMRQMFGSEAPIHCPIEFLIDLGLVRTDLIKFEEAADE